MSRWMLVAVDVKKGMSIVWLVSVSEIGRPPFLGQREAARYGVQSGRRRPVEALAVGGSPRNFALSSPDGDKAGSCWGGLSSKKEPGGAPPSSVSLNLWCFSARFGVVGGEPTGQSVARRTC